MWTLHSANAEHWVPIATVASFKRMRQFQAKGVPWLADVLRRSESLLEVDETGTTVRRREEVREPKNQFERSVYAVCFEPVSLNAGCSLIETT
jgi:lupus La protein